jgi:hypothetical protein
MAQISLGAGAPLNMRMTLSIRERPQTRKRIARLPRPRTVVHAEVHAEHGCAMTLRHDAPRRTLNCCVPRAGME